MRIGPGLGFNGIKQLPTPNDGAQYKAQQRLDNYANRAAIQSATAMQVDGIDFDLWHRTRAGYPCTCSGFAQNPHDSVTNDPGALSESVDPVTSDTGGWGSVIGQALMEHPDRLIDEVIENDDISGRLRTIDTLAGDAPYRDPIAEAMANLSQATIGSGLDAVIYGGDYNACGICFGTQFVGGYQLVTGYRYIFDAHDHNQFTANIFERDVSKKPYVFETDAGNLLAEVAWNFTTPAYFHHVETVALYNNTTPDPAHLSLMWDGPTGFVPLTPQVLNSYKGREVTGRIVIRTQDGAFGPTKAAFTHVAIVYHMRPRLRMQMANLSDQIDYTSSAPLYQSNVILPGELVNLRREDVIFEKRNNNAWLITSLQEQKTATQQIISWSAECRLIRPRDPLYALRGVYTPRLDQNLQGYQQVQRVSGFRDLV